MKPLGNQLSHRVIDNGIWENVKKHIKKQPQERVEIGIEDPIRKQVWDEAGIKAWYKLLEWQS